MTAPPAGRHRPTTVPTHWARPGERRHLARTDGFDWFTARHLPELGPYELPAPPVPAFPPPGEAPTPELDPDDTREIPTLPIPLLPPGLEDDDPEPTGPLPCWATGPLPVVAERREVKSAREALIDGLYLTVAGLWILALFGLVLVEISLGGGAR